MKVLVVGTGGALGGSGITTMADQMTRTLAEMGHEPVRLVAGSQRRKRPNRLNLENVTAVFTEALAVARAARSNRVDVVWLHTFGVPTLPAIRALVQVIAVRLVGRPIIVQLHAFALAEQLRSATAGQRLVVRLVGRWSGHLVTLTAGDADELRAASPAARISVLPNWVEVTETPPPLPPWPPLAAVYVGGLVRRKGLPQLIEAMRLIDGEPIRLRVVGGAGDDGEDVADSIRSAAKDVTDTGSVVFVGSLDAAGVRSELAGSHLLVLPSSAEGTPMAMLEAMAEGRPVLVGDAGDMAQIVRDAGCGWVLPSQEPEAIAGELSQLARDVKAIEAPGERAHSAALGRFSVSAASRRLAEILGKVA